MQTARRRKCKAVPGNSSVPSVAHTSSDMKSHICSQFCTFACPYNPQADIDVAMASIIWSIICEGNDEFAHAIVASDACVAVDDVLEKDVTRFAHWISATRVKLGSLSAPSKGVVLRCERADHKFNNTILCRHSAYVMATLTKWSFAGYPLYVFSPRAGEPPPISKDLVYIVKQTCRHCGCK